MGESITVPKKQLALRTDWRSVTGMVALLAICALAGASELSRIVLGAKPGIAVSWQSWLLLAVFALGFVAQSQIPRWFRIVSLIFALSFASRIFLHLLSARVETQLANAALLRVAYLILDAG